LGIGALGLSLLGKATGHSKVATLGAVAAAGVVSVVAGAKLGSIKTAARRAFQLPHF
jgi:hypothetical protein